MMSQWMKQFGDSEEKIRENFMRMTTEYASASLVETQLDPLELSKRNLMPVTNDGSILKVGKLESDPTLKWTRGSNAKFRYKTFTFVPQQDCSHECTLYHSHSHDHNHAAKETKLSHSNNTELKPIKKPVANSDDDAEPFQLRIGMGFAVEMFEICLKTLKLGQTARFLIMPTMLSNYANMERTLRRERKGDTAHYSSCCGGAAISEEFPDLAGIEESPLELEIEFLELQEAGSFEKEEWEMSISEKLACAPLSKEQGTHFYSLKKYEEAMAKYKRAIILLESIVISSVMVEAERQAEKAKVLSKCCFESIDINGKMVNPVEIYSLLQASRLNYSACCLKLGDYPSVLTQCSEVLKRDPQNIKALFRRAQAYLRIGRDLELAERDLDVLRSIVKSDQELLGDINHEYKLLESKQQSHNAKEKQMYSKIFA